MGLVVKPAERPNQIYRRATFREMIRWRYGPSKEAATPVDLTGATARAYILSEYEQFAAPLAVLTMDDPDRKITLGGQAGTIRLAMTPAVTADLPTTESSVRVIEVLWPDGDICRLVMGRCPIYA